MANQAPGLRLGIDGASLVGPVSNLQLGPASAVPLTKFGIVPLAANDTTTNQYNLMLTAIAAANAGGFSLGFEAGRYNFTGPTGSGGMFNGLTCGFQGVRGKTQIYLMNPGGQNVRWDWSNVSNIVVRDLIFNVTGTLTSSLNNATENHTVMRFGSCDNIRISHVDVNDPFGGAILFRHITNSLVEFCNATGCYKDSFHVTGLSSNVTYFHCKVVDGGDDGFAVVGYDTGSSATARPPENIKHLYCSVYGVKFARCMTYVGAKDCLNVGLYIDGKIPTSRASSALYPYGSTAANYEGAGILVATEVVATPTFSTFGNQNITIKDFTVKNCGRGAYGAVTIINHNNAVTDNIKFENGRIENSAKQGFLHYSAGGGTYGSNVTLSDVHIYDTSDPNGVHISPGTASYPAIELKYSTNFTARRVRVSESGGAALTCSGIQQGGLLDIDLTTVNINKSGLAGVDIIYLVPAIQTAEIKIKLNIEAQPQINGAGGVPYYIDRIIEATNTQGKLSSLEVISRSAFLKSLLLGVPSQAVDLSAAPSPQVDYVITNTGKTSRIYQLYDNTALIAGGASAPALALTDGVASPIYNVISTVKKNGIYTLKPGESLKFSYSGSGLPQIVWWPTSNI